MDLCNINRLGAEDGFVRLTNNGNGFFVYFALIMRVGTHDVVSETANIEVGQSLQIPIPHYVNQTLMNVYASTDGLRWRVVFEREFNIPADYCFSIQGTFNNPTLQRIPCNNFNNVKTDFKIVSENLRNNVNYYNKNLLSNSYCYRKQALPNLCNINKVSAEEGFVRITNDSAAYFIRFSLTMKIGNHEDSIETSDFSIAETRQLPIYGTAISTKLKVYIADIQVNWKLAFSATFKIPSDYCFVARGTYQSPTLERIPCN